MSISDTPRDYSKTNYPRRSTGVKYSKASTLELPSFSQIPQLTTKILLEIVEAFEGCKGREDYIALIERYGKDALNFVWKEYLTDSVKVRIEEAVKA